MGAVENTSLTVFDPPVTSTSSLPVTILYDNLYVVDMSAAESVSNIRSLIHSPHLIAVARSLRGEEAQRLIDFIDRVSDTWLVS